MKTLRTIVAAALVGIGLSLPAQAEDVTFALGMDVAYAPFYLAKERGIFEKHGLNVTILQFANGGEGIDAVAAGQAQVGAAAEQTTMFRMGRGLDLRPITIYEKSGDYIKLVARPGIEDAKDIKTFGVVKGSASEYSTNLTMQKFGMDPASVKIVYSGPPELPALLARGDIDGYFAWEPWPSLGIKQGGKAILTSGDVGYSYTMWLTVSGEWLDQNRATAQQIIDVLTEVNAEIVADPQKAADDFQKATKQPAADTIGFMKSTDWTVRPFNEEDFASFDKIVDFMVAQKITDTPVDFRAAMEKGRMN
ncbi:MAG: ABC transporter substrate-binding protein [Paracoccaceae bacterium]